MRHWFGRGLTDWAMDIGADGAVSVVGGAVITFWNQPTGGVRYTDLLDESGNPITEVKTATAEDVLEEGTIPRFQGPDGVTSMYASANDGVRLLIYTTDVADLVEKVAALESTVEALQTRLAHAMYVMRYDTGVGAYPAIPAELAGVQYLMWVGPPVPATARHRDLHIPTKE